MRITLLGASGSIGLQSIDVIDKSDDSFELVAVSVGNNIKVLEKILKKHESISHACVKNENDFKKLKNKYQNVKWFYGDNGLIELIKQSDCEMVINALVGFVGLKPSLEALNENKILTLANKESLVVGGELIKDLLSRGCGKLFPIDSEHCAISKCLHVDDSNVKELILTASGGSLRDIPLNELNDASIDDVLKHPNWKMGKKITVDSATLINKAFEVVEAHYLFDAQPQQIKAIIHRESMVHSLISYQNGFYRMDVSKPDMKKVIEWAINQGLVDYQTILVDDYHGYKKYHFEEIDNMRYPLFKYGYEVIKRNGIYGAVLNASNEVAVSNFIEGKIKFNDIAKVVEHCMNNIKNHLHPTYDLLKEIDEKTRKKAMKFIERIE